MKYILDGRNMSTRAEAHAEIARVFEFPAYYGKNLDALWDMISTMDAEVVLVNPGSMLETLGEYGKKLLGILQEANETTRSFRFRVEG